MNTDLLLFERQLWDQGVASVAGVDEAGRGPLAGPVVAAAVIVSPSELMIEGVDDSKKLTEKRREQLFDIIRDKMVGFGLGIVSPQEIDQINIHQAALKAMAMAVDRLSIAPGHVLVDGPCLPELSFPCTAVVRGDARCYSIAAASILAKVHRDRLMDDFHLKYPEYGFKQHKGYGTRAHRLAIQQHGRCPIHRHSFSFKPVNLS